MENVEMDFTTRLEDLLNQKQITKIAFLNDLGYSKNAISEWRNGVTRSYMNKIDQIADYLGCSIDYLLGRAVQERADAIPSSMPEKEAMRIAQMYSELNDENKEKAMNFMASLKALDEYAREVEYIGSYAAYGGEHGTIQINKDSMNKSE